MSVIEFGGPGEILPVNGRAANDEFENAIRKLGVVAACEWFGYAADSEFTAKTIDVLMERSASKPA